MAYARIDQETIINFNAGEETAEMYTADPVMIRRMNKLCSENPSQFSGAVHSRYDGKIYAMYYKFPKRFVSIRSKDIKKSEEQREASRQRMQKYHASKSGALS